MIIEKSGDLSDLSRMVSVVVPTKNEESNISACLTALRGLRNIIVVDSCSSDATVAISRELGAEVITFDWNGRFPKKRNWVLRNYPFQTDWVLFLDADEIVSSTFLNELRLELLRGDRVGYWLNYSNHFMGRKLKRGVPQRKLACFRVGAGEYERIEEQGWSSLDMEVHEHPILGGAIGEIKSPIDHRDYRGIARFLERHIDYAKWEALRYIQLQNSFDEKMEVLTGRQSFKYRYLEKSWFSWFYFFYTYFGRLGFLDGRAGYQYASCKKWYFQTVRNIILEQSR